MWTGTRICIIPPLNVSHLCQLCVKPQVCWWCWSWSAAPPLSPPFAGNTYLKQEISKSKYFFSPLLNLKLNQVFKVMFIYRFITMICYEILWPLDRPSLWPQFTSASKRWKQGQHFKKVHPNFKITPTIFFLKRKSILSIWQIEDFSRRFPTWILHCRLNAFYALPILIQTF